MTPLRSQRRTGPVNSRLRELVATYANFLVGTVVITLCLVSIAMVLIGNQLASIGLVLGALIISAAYLSQPRGATMSLAPGRRRRFNFTLAGVTFVSMTILLGLAAMNADVNLLLMLFSVLVAGIVVDGCVAATSLARVKVDITPVPYAIAAEPFDVVVRLHNAKRIFPALGVIVEHPTGDNGLDLVRPAFVPILPRASDALVRYQAVAPVRGLASLASVMLRTRFPFGFFDRWIEFPVRREILVLPRRGVLKRDLIGALLSQISPGPRRSHLRGVDAELRSLREFRPGDDPRHIHWRQSAKHRKLMLREFDSDRETGLKLVLDCTGCGGPDFERAVSFAATVLDETATAGCPGRLIICATEATEFAGSSLTAVPSEADTALATVQADPAAGEWSRSAMLSIARWPANPSLVVTRTGPLEVLHDGSAIVGRDGLAAVFEWSDSSVSAKGR